MTAMAGRAKKDEELERPEEEAADLPAEGTVTRTRPRSKSSAEAGPLSALIDGLDEIVPGLEILDRELVFEGGARTDLAGVDPSGRLHLVLLAGEDADRAALEALDALNVLRSQLELLVRHFGERRVNPERAPRLFVVSPVADGRLKERLAALADAGVVVLGLRTVKSAAGERAYLVRLGSERGTAASPGGVAAFLHSLPARLEPLGAVLVKRMERLDEELEPSADGTTLVWRLRGEVLCRVERVGDLLQGSVAPRHEPLSLADMADLEALVERALDRLVRILGMTPEREGHAGPKNLVARHDAPILTPEEIQAFRE